MSRNELIQIRPKPTLLDRFRSYWRYGNTKDRDFWESGNRTNTGITVSETNALAASPVWCAVALISDDIASLPLHLYRRDGAGKQRYDAHPLYELLHDRPNPEMDSMVLRRTLQAHALIWQNAYAEIERDGTGRPIALWPLVPERVQPFRDGGALRYRVTNPSGGDVFINARDMFHLVGHSHDGSVGSSLVRYAAESIGMTLAAEKFGASFFGNGMTFGGVISYKHGKPPEMSDENYRKTLEARHQGVDRAYRLLALYNDAQFTRGGVTPNEGQFNETRVFQIREVARWFKMPPHKLGDLADATYSNVEQMDAAYYSSCLRPWLVLWQQQLNAKLISPAERFIQFIEHDTHGFLSVDAQARGSLYSSEFGVGSITPNEIRGYENRNPITGGDDGYVQSGFIPLSLASKWWGAQIAKIEAETDKLKEPPPAPQPTPQPSQDMPDQQQMSQALAELRQDLALYQSALTTTKDAEAAARAEIATLTAHLESARTQIEEGKAIEVDLRGRLDGAETSLAAEKEERAREMAEHRDVSRMALDDMQMLVAEIDGLGLQVSQRDAMIAQRDVEIGTRTQENDALVFAVTQKDDEIEALATKAQALEADRDRQLKLLHAAVEDYNTEKQRADTVTATLGTKEAEAVQREAALIAERDAAITDAHAHATRAAEATAQTSDAQAQAAEAMQRAEAAERDKAIAEQAQAIANQALEQIQKSDAERAAAVIAAHRVLLADAMSRIVTKETDRARKHQATPQKLRAWMDTFYDGYEDGITEAILPVVRAHLAWMRSEDEPESFARNIALEHVTQSREQLAQVIQLDDYGAALEKLLGKWEVRRAEAVADRIIADGLTYMGRQR